jgi:hypothetical protein
MSAEGRADYIRKFVVRANHLDELVGLGTLTAPAADFLGACVVAGLNVLVAGVLKPERRRLLNCLTAAVPARERVITCEEVLEFTILPCAERRSGGRHASAMRQAPSRLVPSASRTSLRSASTSCCQVCSGWRRCSPERPGGHDRGR